MRTPSLSTPLCGVALLAILLLAGCGGSTSPTNTGSANNTISVASSSVSVPAGQPYQLAAAVPDGSALTFSVASGGAGGTIDSTNHYVPPADITQGKTTDTINISSASGQTQQITVNLQLAASISPATATASVTGALPSGASTPVSSQVQFTPIVAGDPKKSVKWTVTPVTAGDPVGAINAAGLYSAPASAANGSQVIVTATPIASNPDGTGIASKSATATVTLQSAGVKVPIQ